MKAVSLLTVLVALTLAPASYGAENQSAATVSDTGSRTENPLGAYLGVGTPNPGILSINVGYNIAEFMRAEAGYSSLSASIGTAEASASTIGFGVRGFMPGWRLSPTLGAHFASVSYSSNDSGLDVTVGGFNTSGSHVYLSGGIDYQAQSGFHGGLGYTYSLRSGIGGSTYVQLGWFFDLFS